MMMDAISFTLAFGALNRLAFGCGSIPTSESGFLSFYRGLQDICIEHDMQTKFEQNELLVNCNGSQANVSTSSSVNYRTTLVAKCMLPDGTCLKKQVVLYSGSSSAVINLPAKSIDCLFGACGYGALDDVNYFYNISSCAVDPVTTTMVITPTNASTSPQETTGAADALSTVEVTAQTCVSFIPQKTAGAIGSAVLIAILVVAILILTLSNVAFKARSFSLANNSEFKSDNEKPEPPPSKKSPAGCIL